jgi:CheY-like chemotaxis protein
MSLANVLLVDDEAEFVETFSERLELRDLTIFKAFNGEEALQVLEKNHDMEVAILDVKMPGMNGIETLTEIGSHHAFRPRGCGIRHRRYETGRL